MLSLHKCKRVWCWAFRSHLSSVWLPLTSSSRFRWFRVLWTACWCIHSTAGAWTWSRWKWWQDQFSKTLSSILPRHMCVKHVPDEHGTLYEHGSQMSTTDFVEQFHCSVSIHPPFGECFHDDTWQKIGSFGSVFLLKMTTGCSLASFTMHERTIVKWCFSWGEWRGSAQFLRQSRWPFDCPQYRPFIGVSSKFPIWLRS